MGENLKIEPTEILKYMTEFTIEEYKDGKQIVIYGVSLGTTTKICEIENPFLTLKDKREIAQRIVVGLQKTTLEKNRVCKSCLSVGIQDPNCICADSKHDIIELEFEVCTCCGNLIHDGQPAETEFNEKQLSNLNK